MTAMAEPQSPSSSGPLSGLRVIDLSRVLAGPLCAQTLGDLGADVVKVERPGSGDDTRQWGPPYAGPLSAYYLAVNRNKRSLTLDLSHPDARAVLADLLRGADVVIDNFRVGTMERWGFDDAWFEDNAPSSIRCSITGYGNQGEDASRPGYDSIIQAESGLMSITGEPNGPPMKLGVAIVDICAGMQATIAILAALEARHRTGTGQRCEVNLRDTGIHMLANVASNYLVSGQAPTRHGNAHPNIVPYEVFTASDGDLVVGVGNDQQFAAFARALGEPELAEDPRFATNPERVGNRVELGEIVRRILPHRPREEWIATLLEAGVPAGAINTVPEALETARAGENPMVVDRDHPDIGPYAMTGLPLALSATPASIRLDPPLLGADSEAILTELGYSTDRITRLRESRVI